MKKKSDKIEVALTKHEKYQTTHAKVEPGFVSGIWRSYPKGKEPPSFEIIHETPKANFHFFGKPLGDQELKLFQALTALAAVGGRKDSKPGPIYLKPTTNSDLGNKHRERIELKYDAIDMNMLVVKTTFYELAKEAGYSQNFCGSSNSIKQIKESLERLWRMSVIVKSNDKEEKNIAGFHLISMYEVDDNKNLTVAINPYLAAAILGERTWVRYEMDEVRELKSAPARLIHAHLCQWVDPGGNPQVVTWERLINYAWPYQKTDNPATLRRRKYLVKKAIEEIGNLKDKSRWTFLKDTKGRFVIVRKKIPQILTSQEPELLPHEEPTKR